VSAEIFPWDLNVNILLIFFRFPTLQCKQMFTKRIIVSTPESKYHMKARTLFASILKSFSVELYRPMNLSQKGVLSVIIHRFCWIGAYSHNWVWNGLEVL